VKHLVDYVRRFSNDEFDIAGVDICGTAIIQNPIGLASLRRNASVLATIGRKNYGAQASPSL
jgi:hypothetical protein